MRRLPKEEDQESDDLLVTKGFLLRKMLSGYLQIGLPTILTIATELVRAASRCRSKPNNFNPAKQNKKL